jgi:NAD(P)H-nitrite reductase large subunit
VKFPGEIRQTSGCSSKKFARERAKLKKKKEQTEVLEYWEVARNWDGCVPEISVALVCCVDLYQQDRQQSQWLANNNKDEQ